MNIFASSFLLHPIKEFKYSFAFLAIYLFVPELFEVVAHDRWVLFTSHFLGNFCIYLLISWVICLLAYIISFLHKFLVDIWILLCHVIVIAFSFSNLFLIRVYKTQFNSMILQLISETTAKESSDFINSFIFNENTIQVFVLYFGLISLELILWYSSRFYGLKLFRCLQKSFGVVFLLFLIVNFSFHLEFFSDDYINNELRGRDKPIYTNTIWNLSQGWKQFSDNQKVYKICADVNQSIRIDSCNYTSPNIVLVIGESFNRHHSSLYGYEIETNPRLSQLENLIVFNDVITSVNLTSEAFKNFLSVSNLRDDLEWYEAPLFPAIFKKAGYNVIFYSNQFAPSVNMSVWNASAGFFNHPLVAPLLFNHRNTDMFQYDEGLLDLYKKERSKIEKDSNNLVILHLTGQHLDPKTSYPPSRDNLKAKDINRQDLDVAAKEQVANYDNSTIYNDSVVFEIIDMYKDLDAVVVYFSDHGDEANDFRLHVGRAFDFREAGAPCVHQQFDIPFIVYPTDKYKTNHPEIIDKIHNSKGRPFITDYLPYFLLDLAGISCPYYQENLDLISDSYEVLPRKTSAFIYEEICK